MFCIPVDRLRSWRGGGTIASMSIHASTIQKLLRQHLLSPDAADGRPVVSLRGEEEIEHFRATLRGRVEGRRDVALAADAYRLRSQDDATRDLGVLVVEVPNNHSWRSAVRIELSVDKDGRLYAREAYSRDGFLVPSLDALATLVDDLEIARERGKARDQKREKVQKLQELALIARIKQIAAEDGFEFATIREHQRIKLCVKMAKDEILVMRLSYRDGGQSIEVVRPLIAAARACRENGIAFNMKASLGYPHRNLKWLGGSAKA